MNVAPGALLKLAVGNSTVRGVGTPSPTFSPTA